MTQRHLIIVNPQAMHGETARLTPVIEKLLGSIPHDMVETTSPGHAVELAAKATTLWSRWAATAPCTRS